MKSIPINAFFITLLFSPSIADRAAFSSKVNQRIKQTTTHPENGQVAGTTFGNGQTAISSSSSSVSLKNNNYIQQPIILRDNHHHQQQQQKTKQQQQSSTTFLSAKNQNAEESKSSSTATITKSRKTIIYTAALTLLTMCTAAHFHLLRGPPLDSTSDILLPYSDALIVRDACATITCAILGYILTKVFTIPARDGRLEPRDSRKLIHTLSAPLFMCVGWPLFSNAVDARYFAVLVPLLNALRIVIAGSSDDSDEKELASALSRSGDFKEALGGPFVYVIILSIATILFWRDNLVGVVALSTMAAGDGLADLMGRRFGKNNKWFFSPKKSIAGTIAFFLASTLCSVGLSLWLGNVVGAISIVPTLEMRALIGRIALISAICAFVELLPLGDDNWTVPASAGLLSFLLL